METGLRIALELTELGARLRAQRHRRENPEATEEEVAAVVATWRGDHSIAPDGDAVGKASTWQSIR